MTFEELYMMQQQMADPRINVQQMQARLPNWLRAPAPPNDNVAATRLFAGQMNRMGDVERGQQQLDVENARAREIANAQILNIRNQTKKIQLKQREASHKRHIEESFILSLPPEQQAAARANPKAFSNRMAQMQYQTEPQIVREFHALGGSEGTGMTLPEFYERSIRSRGPTINVGNMPQSIRAETLKQGSMEDALNRYETLIDQHGTETTPWSTEEKAALGASYNNLLMEAKEAFNLGVLSGPDLELLQKSLADPTAITATLKSRGVFKAQIGEMRRKLNAARSRLNETLPEAQRTITKQQDWNQSPSGARWRVE